MRHLAFKADHSGENGGDDPTVVVRDTQSSRQANLLFVDPDRFLVEMIESGLALSRPKWGVVATSYPSEALDVLARHAEFEAIVTEIVFDRTPEAGKLFIRDVGRRWPEIPIFVMTHLDPEETRGLETAEYIAKPPDMDFLVSRIARAIRRQRESLVRGISLATFAQILEMEQKTCTVIVSHGGRVGELYFRDGRLIQARLEGTEGEDALFGMLSMREHSLRVVDRCDANRRISASLVSLLMEWSAREDHARRSDSPLRQEEG